MDNHTLNHNNKQIKYPEPHLKVGCRALDQFCFPSTDSIAMSRKPQHQSQEFLTILNSRRSGRAFLPVKLAELGPLFFHGNRKINSYRDPWGARFEQRNYASGGGLHSLHCIITELASDTWYVYNSDEHSFDIIEINAEQIRSFKDTCSQLLQSTENAWLIWTVCDHDRFCSRYSNADTVIFREAGHLSATHALIAEYLGLTYCPLGFHGFEEAAQLSTERRFVGVGCALIGNKL